MASECLTLGYGEAWTFSFGKSGFLSPAELAESEAERVKSNAMVAEQAAAKLKAKQDAVLSAEIAASAYRANAQKVTGLAYDACTRMLKNDPTAALTNKLCFDLFTEIGLPAY